MAEIHLADRMELISESATLALNARVKQMAKDGATVYNLTAGELASDTPYYIQTDIKGKLHHNKYTAVAGMPELREAIAKHTQKLVAAAGRPELEAANVVVTAGGKPALYGAFLALLNPGDEVIVPTPAWVSHLDLIRLAGGVVVEVPLAENYDIDIDAIRERITDKTKMILLNSPHNPTGAIFSQDKLQHLAGVLAGRNITVLSDEMYAKLVFDEKEFTLPSAIKFEHVVIVNGFSKSQALTGWRIGYLVADATVAAAVTTLLSHINANASIISQYAALAAMARDDKAPESTMKLLHRHREITDAALSDIPLIKHQNPGGGFYVYIDIREITENSVEWCEHLLNQKQVALVPGEAFGTPGFARLSFVTDEKTLVEALKRINEFVSEEEGVI